MNNFVQILGDVVERVNTALIADLSALTIQTDTGPVNRGIESVNYVYGPYKEILRRLQSWAASETYEPKRYPLVALIQPFNETNGADIGFDVDSVDIAICMLSNSQWYTEDRYTNNFYPVLYPIYEQLLLQLHYDPRLLTVNETQISHTKIDWPFWDAGQDKNPFNDVLDVVELKNLKLKILFENC